MLVEDNMQDAVLIIRDVNLANNLVHVKDGAEALEFIFATGKYFLREAGNMPKVFLPDIKDAMC